MVLHWRRIGGRTTDDFSDETPGKWCHVGKNEMTIRVRRNCSQTRGIAKVVKGKSGDDRHDDVVLDLLIGFRDSGIC